MQNFNIAYAKSFLGDQIDTVIRTVDIMIKRRLPGAIVFENLVMPGNPCSISESSPQEGSVDALDQKTRELVSKCLRNHILMICNYGPNFPEHLAESIFKFGLELGLPPLKILIEPDKVIPGQLRQEVSFYRFDKQNNLRSRFYKDFLNGGDLSDCIRSGVQMMFTKNLSYSSLILRTSMAHFDWSEMDQNQLASASIIGSLLESDLQSDHFSWRLKKSDDASKHIPKTLAIAEFSDDGSCVISKPDSGKDHLNSLIVKKLYEIDEPNSFISQDIIVDISKLIVENLGENNVRIRGAIGHPLRASQYFDGITM